jgi:LEA14-like dessication related protein
MATRSKTRIIILIISAIILVGVIGYYFYKSRYANPVSGLKPHVTMGIGRISNITDSTIDLSLNLFVDNPLPVGLDIRNFRYSVDLNRVRVIESEYADALKLEPQDSAIITLPTQLKIKKLAAISEKSAAAGEDSADYRFEVALNLEKPFLGKDTLNLHFDKRLPLYRLPKVELVGYDMEKFRLSKSDVVIQLRFTNQNAFPVQFQNPSYVVDLGNQKGLAKGAVKGFTKVKSKSSEIYEIPLEIKMGDLLKTAGNIIFKGKDLPFTLHFKCKLVSENDVFRDSDVNIVVDGELKDLEAVKKNMGK